jgi:hypothetical protein
METMVKEKTAVRTQTKKVDFPTLGGVRYMTTTSDDYRDLLSRPEAEPLYIKAIDVVSGPFGGEDDEEKVYNLVKTGLLQKRKVVLSLSGIRMLGLFCNGTVGRLYAELPREFLDANLRCVDASADSLLRDAIEMGTLYQYNRPLHAELIDTYERLIEEYT